MKQNRLGRIPEAVLLYGEKKCCETQTKRLRLIQKV